MRIMAVDYGESRTGIAVCDPTEFLASPVCIIKEKNTLKAIDKIVEKAKELKAEQIVVGHPLNMNGTRGERAEKCTFVKEWKNCLALKQCCGTNAPPQKQHWVCYQTAAHSAKNAKKCWTQLPPQ